MQRPSRVFENDKANGIFMKPTCKINSFGDKFWRLNGQLHREDGPAIEYPNGHQFWYLNGLRHRENGPACEYDDGDKHWFLHGKLHREDGPAVERADGYNSWYYHDKHIDCKDNQEFLRIVKLMVFL